MQATLVPATLYGMRELAVAMVLIDDIDGDLHAAFVDREDYDRVMEGGPWVVAGGLAEREVRVPNGPSTQRLGDFVARAGVTYPLNGNPLDARKANLKVRTPEPLSLKAICRLTGTPTDGHTRAALAEFLDTALFNVWELACNKHGAPEAACFLWQITSRDPSFALPLWLERVYKRHRRAILEAFQ